VSFTSLSGVRVDGVLEVRKWDIYGVSELHMLQQMNYLVGFQSENPFEHVQTF